MVALIEQEKFLETCHQRYSWPNRFLFDKITANWINVEFKWAKLGVNLTKIQPYNQRFLAIH